MIVIVGVGNGFIELWLGKGIGWGYNLRYLNFMGSLMRILVFVFGFFDFFG